MVQSYYKIAVKLLIKSWYKHIFKAGRFADWRVQKQLCSLLNQNRLEKSGHGWRETGERRRLTNWSWLTFTDYKIIVQTHSLL